MVVFWTWLLDKVWLYIVIHAQYKKREIIIILAYQWPYKLQNNRLIIYFVYVEVIFYVTTHFLNYRSLHNFLIIGKYKLRGPPYGWNHVFRIQGIYTLGIGFRCPQYEFFKAVKDSWWYCAEGKGCMVYLTTNKNVTDVPLP